MGEAPCDIPSTLYGFLDALEMVVTLSTSRDVPVEDLRLLDVVAAPPCSIQLSKSVFCDASDEFRCLELLLLV